MNEAIYFPNANMNIVSLERMLFEIDTLFVFPKTKNNEMSDILPKITCVLHGDCYLEPMSRLHRT